MKYIKFISTSALVGISMLATATAKATPVQYEFSGVFGDESPFISSTQLSTSQYPVPTGTVLSGSFIYDSSIPISSATNIASASLTNLEGSIGNSHFSAANGNSYFTTSFFVGEFSTSQGSNFVGLTANGLTLTGFAIGYQMPTSTELPPTLPEFPPFGIRLEFSDGGKGVYYFFSNSTTVTPVPLPSTVWLFSSCLFGLAAVARRNS